MALERSSLRGTESETAEQLRRKHIQTLEVLQGLADENEALKAELSVLAATRPPSRTTAS